MSPARPSIWTREQTTHIVEWDKQREYRRVYGANRTAKRASMPATLLLDEWQRELDFWKYSCAYCLRRGFDCLEHVIPVSKGGATSAANVVPACRGCNHAKIGHDGEYQVRLAENLLMRGNAILAKHEPRPVLKLDTSGTPLSAATARTRKMTPNPSSRRATAPTAQDSSERSRIKMSATPAPTQRWQPIAHQPAR